MKKLFIFFYPFIILGTASAQQSPDSLRKYNALDQKPQVRQTPAQQLIANTGEDSMSSFGSVHSKTVISGYGELYYQRDFDRKQSLVDLKRAVLFVGHQFTGKRSEE